MRQQQRGPPSSSIDRSLLICTAGRALCSDSGRPHDPTHTPPSTHPSHEARKRQASMRVSTLSVVLTALVVAGFTASAGAFVVPAPLPQQAQQQPANTRARGVVSRCASLNALRSTACIWMGLRLAGLFAGFLFRSNLFLTPPFPTCIHAYIYTCRPHRCRLASSTGSSGAATRRRTWRRRRRIGAWLQIPVDGCERCD